MATQTRTRKTTRKTAPAKAASKTATKPAAKKGRPGVSPEVQAERREAILERVVNGDESIGDVAKDLGIQTGKAAFIKMQIQVDQGDVPVIKFRNDEELVTKTIAARDKADQYSSWGWLSARTGIGEATLKTKVVEAGHSLGTNVASVRKAANPKKAAAPRTSAAAKKPVATKKRTVKRGTRNPS